MFFVRHSVLQRVSIVACLVLTLILVACQPPPAPVQEQLDQPPDGITAEDLIGVWIDNYEVYNLFREDGTFRSAESLGGFETSPIFEGVYQLQGAQLILTSSDEGRFCRGLTGSYELRLTAEGKLEMDLIEDPCTDRGIVWNSNPLSRVPEADVKLALALEANRAVVVRYMEELWNQGDLAVADEVLAEDFVSHNFPAGDREALKGAIAGFRAENPNAYFDLNDIVVTVDKAFIQNTLMVRPEGAPANARGEAVSPPMMLVLGVEDDRITDRWLYMWAEAP